jgi:hypothetical protein
MSDNNFPPRDYDRLEPWFNIMRHANRVIVFGSVQWLEIGVFIDADGKPRMWEVTEPRNLYPKSVDVKIED